MRIALISAEYAGAVHAGGIGTYMRNLADMLVSRGHDVEVFASDNQTKSEKRGDRLFVNLVACEERWEFPARIAPIFQARHDAQPFDVAEGAEFLAETRDVSTVAPDLPLVLKLHTSSAVIGMVHAQSVRPVDKLRYIFGGLRKGILPKPYWKAEAQPGFEYENLKAASEITSPCLAMVEMSERCWGVSLNDVRIIPNVFVPPAALLHVTPETQTGRVSFVGRLEYRKGVVDLARAIPRVLDADPTTKFRFIGRSLPHPTQKVGMREYLERMLGEHCSQVEFIEGLPYDEALQCYGQTDVCVFPSVWENFPNVCLEAMSAARGVVGSAAGGMAEMLQDGCGLVVPPGQPREIARAISQFIRTPSLRMEMGIKARSQVLARYSWDAIGPAQEASYLRAIAARRLDRSSKEGRLAAQRVDTDVQPSRQLEFR